MLLLAVDTSTPRLGVALHDGTDVLAVVARPAGRSQGEQLVPAVREAMTAAGTAPADVTAVVCGVGPGPYTGLRVGIVTALVLGRAWGVPVHGVCSLDAVAWAAVRSPDAPGAAFVAVSDARRREVYWAGYDAEGARLAGPCVARPDDLPEPWAGAPASGPVPPAFAAAFPARCGPTTVSAADVAAVAAAALSAPDSAAAETAVLLPPEPLYLRRPDATEPQPEPPLLRRMRWWDVPAVAAIEAELFPGTAWSPATFWAELGGVPATRHYLVAVDDGAVRGYAGLAALPPDADVQTIAVAPGAQRRGIGDRLLSALLEEASRRGAHRVHLEVEADNAAALGLYRRHGFDQISRRRSYYGPGRDALVLRAVLPPEPADGRS